MPAVTEEAKRARRARDRARSDKLRKERAVKGLKRIELWAPPEHHDAIRAYAASLEKTP